ncbi:MAG: M24 family metallopeptidase [Candidatus Doudnabacteria bacterium]|nr:M24 family metallopeptidase [Candidatus Doudnabacteria bacterium]
MNSSRIKNLQLSLQIPVLIKKKENLLYLTGRSFMHGYLLVQPRQINADRKRINTEVVFLGDGLEKIEGVKADFLKNVGKYIGKKETLEVFGDFTYAEVRYIRSRNKELGVKISVKRDPVDYLRMIKEPGEIAQVKKSMQIVERVFGEVRKKLRSAGPRPALTESQLAQFIQSTGLKMGAHDVSFPAIVASGVNAAVPHHVPSAKRLKPGESIILDFGFKCKGYCSDFTRTVFLKKVPKRLEMAYNQVEKAYWGSIEYINQRNSLGGGEARRGNRIRESGPFSGGRIAPRAALPSNAKMLTGNDVYQRSVDILAEKHLDKYFIHSLGHGTGLEIHELPNLSPNSKDIMRDNMVFSIEPGVYIKGLGGIRIEDLVYLENGQVKKFINVPTLINNGIIK